ncbi:MAG: VOC family protein [Chloroflexi bacterium]|nr:VOC family protein [Chloroflexota bacterium]
MLTRIDHIDVTVRDLEAHVQFYQTLGFVVAARTEHRGESVELKLPGENQVVLELREALPQETPGVRHIAFATDDLQKTGEELAARGIAFEKVMHLQPTTGRYLSNAIDPSGGHLQLVSPVRDPHTIVTKA